MSLFFNDRRVCVTGGAGFLGSYLVEALTARGCDHIFVPRIEDYNLVDREDVLRMYRDARPDIVIHLAAVVGGIGANMAQPGTFFYDNAMMGIQLMHEAWRSGVEKFVALGTICAYPKHTPVPFREDMLWEGYPEETNAPYGLAKKMLLVQSMAYRAQYGFNSIFLLPVNLYGPGDNFSPESSHVIPALIRKIDEAQRLGQPGITVWGDGSPTREFLYVRDAAEGILLAAEHYNKPDPVNLGTGREITIRDLVYKIASIMEYKGEIHWDTSKPNGQPRRCLDVTRAMQEFGFQSGMCFDDGLTETIRWYRSTRGV